jgi:hypothetical protein
MGVCLRLRLAVAGPRRALQLSRASVPAKMPVVRAYANRPGRRCGRGNPWRSRGRFPCAYTALALAGVLGHRDPAAVLAAVVWSDSDAVKKSTSLATILSHPLSGDAGEWVSLAIMHPAF